MCKLGIRKESVLNLSRREEKKTVPSDESFQVSSLDDSFSGVKKIARKRRKEKNEMNTKSTRLMTMNGYGICNLICLLKNLQKHFYFR